MKKKINFLFVIFLFSYSFAVENFVIVEENKMLDLIPNVNSDDSAYDDSSTLEFCLKDDSGRNLCLYHNIRKQNGIDFDNYEVYKDWSTQIKINRWVRQNIDGVSVIWNYMNGAILIMETTSSNWSTGRGIKVGDPISKANEIYSPDATIYKWDYEKKKSVKILDNPNRLYFLTQANEGILIYIANLIDEEIMNMRFTNENGIITKIEIFFSN